MSDDKIIPFPEGRDDKARKWIWFCDQTNAVVDDCERDLQELHKHMAHNNLFAWGYTLGVVMSSCPDEKSRKRYAEILEQTLDEGY